MIDMIMIDFFNVIDIPGITIRLCLKTSDIINDLTLRLSVLNYLKVRKYNYV